MLSIHNIENLLEEFEHGLIEDNTNKIDILKNKTILLYGAGNIGKRLYKGLLENNINVHAFIDKNTRLDVDNFDIPLYHPESNELKPFKESAYVILSALFQTEICFEIKDYLLKLNFKNVYSLNEINFSGINKIAYFEKNFDDTFTKLDILGPEKQKIIQTYSLLAEDDDRKLFIEYLRAQLTLDFTRLRKPYDTKLQYIGHDIQEKKNYSNFIDCGCFDGDTIRQLQSYGIKINNLIAFEPQNNLYKKVIDYIKDNSELFQTAFILPCGVHSETKTVHFSVYEDTLSAGKIDQEGKDIIQCVKIDDVIYGFKPTFIKMDIEGAELEALKGAKETISYNKPQLAICVYHTLSHLWEIPLLIHSYYNRYKFYLKSYNYMGLETVLYAIPT